MKKVLLILVICLLLIGVVSAVQSNQSQKSEAEQNEFNDSTTQINKSKIGLGQMIRNRVKAGVYTNSNGEDIRVSELARNRTRLRVKNVSVDCDCNLTEERVNNKTKLMVRLKNGRNAEVKIMPNNASEKALKRLRLKNCNETNDCSLELKEVGKGNKTRLAYEMKANKNSKLFGLFNKKMQVQSRVDAETGDVIDIKKPWWAFLASEKNERGSDDEEDSEE